MTPEQLTLDIAEWGISAAFYAAVAFPFVTRLYWAWEKSAWGWNIITLELAIALAMFPSWLHITFGVQVTGLGFLIILAVSLWIIPIVIIWRAIIIWKTQRYIDQEEDKK